MKLTEAQIKEITYVGVRFWCAQQKPPLEYRDVENILCDLARAQIRAQEQKPRGYERYVGDKFHSFAKTTEGWNAAFCKPLYAAPPVPQGMILVNINDLKGAAIWLRAALDCKNFAWDVDQHECADAVCKGIEDMVSAAQGGKNG